jgi:hypothetical protein
MRWRAGRANPGHALPLRGKTRAGSALAVRTDFVVRDFSISALTRRRSALSDALAGFL